MNFFPTYSNLSHPPLLEQHLNETFLALLSYDELPAGAHAVFTPQTCKLKNKKQRQHTLHRCHTHSVLNSFTFLWGFL